MNRAVASKTPKKNLLLAFDAFGTLFTPKAPIAAQYGEVARRYQVAVGVADNEIKQSFGKGMTRAAEVQRLHS